MTASPSTIQVVLADDHALVRSGIRALLSQTENIRVIAEAGDGRELLELLEYVRPDVVITDIAMPHMDGITAVRHIRQMYPRLPVIMLSMTDSADAIRQAVAGGANGFVRKDAPATELESAVRKVMADGRYFGTDVAERLLTPAAGPPEDEQLTERQIQILTLLASGMSSREIGSELNLSPKTVDVHRMRIMARLDLNDVASLTRYAVRRGLVKL